MLLGGLWHGAGWTFILWGGLHGLYLMISHGWREIKTRLGWTSSSSIERLTGGTLTFVAVVVAWVFFRADNLAAAQSMLASMFGAHAFMPEAWVPSREALKIIIPSLALAWLMPNVPQMLARYKPTWEDMADKNAVKSFSSGRLATRLAWKIDAMHAIALALLFIFCLNSLTKVSEFLYFRF